MRQQLLLTRREEQVAPVERRAQRLVSVRPILGVGAQQVEAVFEPGQDRRRREQFYARGGQFNSQRQAVQADADFGDRGGVGVASARTRAAPLARARRTAPPTARPRPPSRAAAAQFWHRERRHGHLVLPAQAERCATGRQYFQLGARGQQVGDVRGRVEDLFEVVQDQQQLLVAQRRLEAVEQAQPATLLANTQRPGDLPGHQSRHR